MAEEINSDINSETSVKAVRKVKRKYIFLRALFITLLLFLGYKILGSSKWYYPQNIFSEPKAKRLSIVGTYITSKQDILDALKSFSVPKLPLYMIDVRGFEDKILQIETVKNVYIRRYWFPARLQIVVEDKMPVILIAADADAEPAAFFAEGGKMLPAELLPADPALYPLRVLTKGRSDDNFIEWKEDRINEIVDIADKVRKYTGENIKYVDVREPHDIYVSTETVDLRLGEPDETLEDRLKSVMSILPELNRIEEKIDYIDLRWDVTKYIKTGEKNEDRSSSVKPENGEN